MAIMNYLYLKVSDAPVKVGDLTTEGIIQATRSDGISYINDFPYRQELNDFKVLTPLLIMDAPENIGLISDKLFYALNPIPFHSNDQVYSWMQSKGIKPEAEMLVEFDGEVEIKYLGCEKEDFIKHFTIDEYQFNTTTYFKKKVAIIKEPEVKQESEDERAMTIIRDNVKREIVDDRPKGGQHAVGSRTHKLCLISDELDLKICTAYHRSDIQNWELLMGVFEEVLKQHFKIERH